ncbi:MAG: hypothetical protein IKD43_04360 [Clostridia bacterium]|nr:hypothetical protein [Clostridia bacterium]
MRIRFPYGGTVFCAALFLFILTLSFFVGIFAWNGRTYTTLELKLTYHFLVRDCGVTTSGAVAGESYLAGGAGYLIEKENAVALACYYQKADAEFVRGTMSENGVLTRVLTLQTDRFALEGDWGTERANIEANAKTVDSLTRILFETANGLDRVEISQDAARAAVSGVVSSLGGLSAGNAHSCYDLWNVELLRAQRKGREIAEGIVFAKDLRYLQIQLCMAVLHLADYFA